MTTCSPSRTRRSNRRPITAVMSPHLALLGPHAMSDSRPKCASKRTSAAHSKFIGYAQGTNFHSALGTHMEKTITSDPSTAVTTSATSESRSIFSSGVSSFGIGMMK
jgi:hypothetical protein